MSSPAAPPTPIETLLRVKRAAEEGAARRWRAAIAQRAAAEEAQARLEAALVAARDDLRARRAGAAGGPAGLAGTATTAGAGGGRERFWGRLRQQIAASAERAQAHRQGALAAARTGAEATAAAHLAARVAREQVEKVCQNADADRRRAAARRDEVALDEQAQATALTRPARP